MAVEVGGTVIREGLQRYFIERRGVKIFLELANEMAT